MKFFDLHCDTLYKFNIGDYSIKENSGHITEQSLKNADYLAESFAIFIPRELLGEEAFEHYLKQYKVYQKMLSESQILKSAKNLGEIEENSKNNKVSAILTVENAEVLDGKLERIKFLQDQGVKILGLIHNGENCIGYPHTIPEFSLKDFGKEVVDAVNNTDLTIDVSHLNYKGFWDVVSLSEKPIIATHSCCRSVYEHTRNLDDEQIKAIANSGGIVGINFYNRFLKNEGKTEIVDILTHLEYLIKIGGEDVAAMGTDFDGIECEMFLKTCADIPILTDEIIKKFGYNIAEKICFKNAMRIMETL